jgi:hypothetical protein
VSKVTAVFIGGPMDGRIQEVDGDHYGQPRVRIVISTVAEPEVSWLDTSGPNRPLSRTDHHYLLTSDVPTLGGWYVYRLN